MPSTEKIGQNNLAADSKLGAKRYMIFQKQIYKDNHKVTIFSTTSNTMGLFVCFLPLGENSGSSSRSFLEISKEDRAIICLSHKHSLSSVIKMIQFNNLYWSK